MKKIRILQFPIANSKGGITQYVLRNWKYIDKSQFQFDFATMSKTLSFSNQLEKDGCKIYYISCYAEQNREKFADEFRKILLEGKYDIVHLHTKQWKSFQVEQIAKEVGIKKIIIHAHSTSIDTLDKHQREIEIQLHNNVLEQLTEDVATDFWSCSLKASDFIFGDRIRKEKINFMPNAIELSKYIYKPEIRKQYRENMGISEDECVIGNVGRFVYSKNQEFLIEVFFELCKSNNVREQKYKLLLIGSGEREEEYKRLVYEKQLCEQVIFAGHRSDVPELLQAMDIFCLPSRFEGLPISLVEAQASGLPCIASDCVTMEADITGSVYYKRFNTDEWVECILKILGETHDRKHITYEQMSESRYNIENQIKDVEKRYREGI